MEDNIKLYEYDYAAYFTGRIIEIGPHEGYQPGHLTTVPVPSIPEGHYAKFEKSIGQWIITDREAPPYISLSEEDLARMRDLAKANEEN
ncbi:hypothetical protein UFOVP908_141 [uncultured Caudovirales phage]|uniref:Uncharacterized protein n=1 Tax=uncultured Caudovirales phage TaxID=2100421 RepID=A0A6J7XAE9_9CAUD|nr:hypothetical protein UFOVP908_141 [uncultured Caudovirales phage]CAB4177177.1 hypothetical protein UFOVP990_228 [uncultured Caudovirales phage]CAB4181376.1 hypothetical protein UFOVP1065_26 [uncultured Caudovirales phage]CAB4190888.1 hypothetical protein UFOVP1198_228 [uncultured Caudovirales phage]CAB4211239.1 hypothetical protein UFOVP1418_220 [uncultured Caudovirales phage]